MSKSIKVYSTSTCPYCMMLKEYFKEKNVQYENFDVGQDKDALKEMKDKSGQFGVPVIDIEGKIIVGFDKEELNKELGL
ncbi:MAG: glutaredoxin domain-containing protein [Elusimicrobiota bacterium]